jgi:hypothetical protein
MNSGSSKFEALAPGSVGPRQQNRSEPMRTERIAAITVTLMAVVLVGLLTLLVA